MNQHKLVLIGTLAGALIVIAGSIAIFAKVRSIASEEQIVAAPIEENLPIPAGNFHIGDTLPDFTLEDAEGNSFTLSSALDGEHYVVINFHHPDCPCAENCGILINEMTRQGYDDVLVVGILSSGTSDPRVLSALEKQRADGSINFPIYLDHDREILDLLGATRTPELWLLDKSGRIAFHGAPESTLFPGSPGHRYLLREAIDALRAGNTPEIQNRDPIGCPIEGC